MTTSDTDDENEYKKRCPGCNIDIKFISTPYLSEMKKSQSYMDGLTVHSIQDLKTISIR